MPEEGQEAGVLLEGGEDAINGKSLVDDELKALLDEIRDFLERWVIEGEVDTISGVLSLTLTLSPQFWFQIHLDKMLRH